MSAAASLRAHWPEYAIEAWALGMFMVSAGVVTTLVESPMSPIRAAIADETARRALIGLGMGLTAIALIYSPWGRRSGAHMNPSVTLAFAALGRIARWDAFYYVLAQFVGGLVGVFTVASMLGGAFTMPPVSYVATLPGSDGVATAFVAECVISAALMSVVLMSSSAPRIAPFTGVIAGTLVATYITFEAPLSGMSMNPARTFASNAPAGLVQHLWLYFIAPPLGMGLAALAFTALRGGAATPCAKLRHAATDRCIHCGQEPAP